MEVAPRYKLLTLFTLFKQLWSKKFILPVCKMTILLLSKMLVGWLMDDG